MPSMSGIDCTEVSVSAIPVFHEEGASLQWRRARALCADTAGTDYLAVLPNVTAASRTAWVALSALFSMFSDRSGSRDSRRPIL